MTLQCCLVTLTRQLQWHAMTWPGMDQLVLCGNCHALLQHASLLITHRLDFRIGTFNGRDSFLHGELHFFPGCIGRKLSDWGHRWGDYRGNDGGSAAASSSAAAAGGIYASNELPHVDSNAILWSAAQQLDDGTYKKI